MIIELQCEGYKAFKAPVKVDIPRLTIFFGKNSSGKTTLARLPILIAASMTNPEQFYSLSAHNLDFASSFTDLASTIDPHPSLTLGVRWSARRSLMTRLQHVSSQQDPDYVQPSFIQVDRTSRTIKLDSKRSRTARDLIDSQLPAATQLRLDQRINSLKDLLETLVHIPSFRPTIEPIYSVRSPSAWVIDEVPYILHSRHRLLDAVDEWFRKYLDGSGVGIDHAAFAFRLVEKRDDAIVNFTQSGRGPQSSLPVVTLLHAIASGMKRSPLVIVEEPEAHLHPSVHGDMADLVLRCAEKTQLIVETHSENFLLRVRRKIAEGRISKDDIALYYIDEAHSVIKISLDEYGGTDNWPTGVFESDIEEAGAIVEARISAMRALEGNA